MKTIKYITIVTGIIILSFSCKKEEIFYGGIGLTATYVLNKYILTDMKAEIFSNNDTCKYSDVTIKLNFKGLLVGEDVENSVHLGVDPTVIETPYFINVIKDIDIKAYSNNYNYYYYKTVFYIYRQKIDGYIHSSSLIGEELGYSPKYLFLKNPPDTSDYYCFTVKITDIYDNQFVATTDSIYITK